MKIAITGHSGYIGTQLLAKKPPDIEFIKLGRNNSDVFWKLGILPDPSKLYAVDSIVHLAWATTGRKTNFHINVGGTIQLANLARDLGCPFLFVSSVGVDSESHYGKSKFLAEKGVIQAGGQVLRLGLTRTTNRYLESKKKQIAVYPKFRNLIPITEFESFADYLVEWVRGSFASGQANNKIATLVDDYRDFESLVNAKIQIPIPEKIVGIALNTLGKLNYRFYDIYDAYKTITTRKDFI